MSAQQEIVHRFETTISEARLAPCTLQEYVAALREVVELLEAELGAALVALEDGAATEDGAI